MKQRRTAGVSGPARVRSTPWVAIVFAISLGVGLFMAIVVFPRQLNLDWDNNAEAVPVTTAPPTSVAPAAVSPSTLVPSTVVSTPAAPTSAAPTTAGVPVAPATLAPAGPVLWSEDFASAAGMDRLAKVIHEGDNRFVGNPPQRFNGDHDHNCGGPTTGRPLVEDYQVSTHFWHCAPGGDAAKGHFMTGVNTAGYVIVAFAPVADDGVTARVFPASATQMCWDQNLTDLELRKWTQLVVVSADRFRANGSRIDYVNPDFNDNGGTGPRAAVRLAGDDFLFMNMRNTVQFFQGQSKVFSDFGTDRFWGSTDKATRYATCVQDNGNGTVTRTQARPGGGVSTVTGPGRFPAGPRVFILQDDSYNPMKSYQDGATQWVTDPFTWHWDNLRVS